MKKRNTKISTRKRYRMMSKPRPRNRQQRRFARLEEGPCFHVDLYRGWVNTQNRKNMDEQVEKLKSKYIRDGKWIGPNMEEENFYIVYGRGSRAYTTPTLCDFSLPEHQARIHRITWSYYNHFVAPNPNDEYEFICRLPHDLDTHSANFGETNFWLDDTKSDVLEKEYLKAYRKLGLHPDAFVWGTLLYRLRSRGYDIAAVWVGYRNYTHLAFRDEHDLIMFKLEYGV